ncbi:hypothetical protein GBA52_009768 [Prunus armeniaca]|nr:hypothetical protein GBA52_009768 [Prunus armeniaca]
MFHCLIVFCWRQFGVVALVWVAIVALQIAMRNSWRFAEFRWRIHYGSTVSGDWDPSSALYFAAATILFAVIGQNFGGKVIKALGRTYLIIFILAFTTLGSTVSLGGSSEKMAGKIGTLGVGFLVLLALSSAAVSAHEEMLGSQPSSQNITGKEVQSHLGYKHVWPVSPIFYYLRWVCCLNACMITGTATATVMYNLRRRHPTLDLPIIDYDLALLFQPVLVLGISIGVSLNVVLSDWMITILLFIVLLGVSTKSFFKGVETWKRETITKKAGFKLFFVLQVDYVEDKYIPGGPSNGTLTETKEPERTAVPVLDNVRWKELGVIVAVWIIILALQIVKIPVAVGVTSYQAVNLYKGRRVIASKGEETTKWPLYKLVSYCACGTAAGMLGGLLGLGGAFMLGPMFLEMGIPPQVSSATATFAMTFSSSMSVVEYYLLNRFPVPYALYFAAVTTVSAIAGQHVAGKVGLA